MERYLSAPEQWRRWLDLLAEAPELAAELDARASLLVERTPGNPEDVLRAMEHAAAVTRAVVGRGSAGPMPLRGTRGTPAAEGAADGRGNRPEGRRAS